MFWCVNKLVVNKSCAVRNLVQPWRNKTALRLLSVPVLPIMEEQVTHLKNLAIAAILLGKCTMSDRRAKKGVSLLATSSGDQN